MQNETNCRGAPAIEVKKVVSVLPDDYSKLENKPAIDGVVLSALSTSEELGLLSSDPEKYETVTLTKAIENKMSVITIDDLGTRGKLSVDALAQSCIDMVDELDESVPDGKYVFLKLSKNEGEGEEDHG